MDQDLHTRCLECLADDFPGFLLDLLQMHLAIKAFSINFIDILGSGRAGGKPAVFSHHFQAANG